MLVRILGNGEHVASIVSEESLVKVMGRKLLEFKVSRGVIMVIEVPNHTVL